MQKATNLKTKALSVILVLLMALAFLPLQAFADDVVGVTGITISNDTLSMQVGSTHKLSATVSPADATNTAVNWESNKTDVASVDATGTVTAKSAGTAYIYATSAADDTIATSCEVTVTASTVAVTGVSMSSTSLSLPVGGSSTLTTTVTPSDATNKTVSWRSSDATVANVDSNGKVTAQKAGSTTITATTADGGKTATCSVTVTTATASSYTVVATPVTDDSKKGGTVSIDSTTSYSDSSISKTVNSGASVTVRAKTNSGYSFLGWYENNAVLTTSTTYTTTVTKARELEARFAKGTIYTITTYASPTAGGTVTGGGKYKSGDTVTLEATTKSGYTFEGWYEGSTTSSRKSKETTYKFNAKANVTVYAKFTDGTYEITVNKSGNGEVDGGGKYEEGERCTLEAVPDKGYVFDGWYESSELVNSRKEYTFTVRKDRTFTGKFVKAGTATTTTTTTTATTTTTTTTTSATAKTSELAESQATKSAREAAASAQKAGNKNATVKLKNIGDVSLETLNAMRREAGMELKFQADTMTASGKSVDVRITIDPSKATKNVNLSASKTNEKSQKTRAFFAKWFSNTTQVLSLGQSGTFGCDVEIAVKLDFKGMDKNNLVFYSYDSSKNTYKKIEPTKFWIDKNGYLHIQTNAAGNLVVSSGKLKKK